MGKEKIEYIVESVERANKFLKKGWKIIELKNFVALTMIGDGKVVSTRTGQPFSKTSRIDNLYILLELENPIECWDCKGKGYKRYEGECKKCLKTGFIKKPPKNK